MLAAIERLTLAVENQSAQLDTLNASQAAASSVLETMQKGLDVVQAASDQHQIDVAAQRKATRERLEACLAQATAPLDPERSNSPPRKVHTHEGAGDDGMGVATPTAPPPAVASPHPPLRAATRSSSAGRASQPPPPRARATSAPPSHDDYPEVALLKLPIPRADVVVRKWLDPMLASATAFPTDFEHIVPPFHDSVTLNFRTVKDAGAATVSLRRLAPVFEVAPGDSQKVIVIHSGAPEVRRRHPGLQHVYDMCRSVAADGVSVKSIPRARGRTPHTIYYLVNATLDTQRKVCKAYWRDDGDSVEVTSILPDTSLDSESQDMLADALKGDGAL